MSFEDWIFALHVTMAALLVGSLVMSWIVIVSLLTTDTPGTTLSLHRVKLVATGATIIGLLFTPWAVPAGVVLGTICLVGWFWPRRPLEP